MSRMSSVLAGDDFLRALVGDDGVTPPATAVVMSVGRSLPRAVASSRTGEGTTSKSMVTSCSVLQARDRHQDGGLDVV